MTKKKIERISIMYKKEIMWLKCFFLSDNHNPKRTILERKIHDSFLANKTDEAAFYVNLNMVTREVISETDELLVRVLKEVYVYESMDIVEACQNLLFLNSLEVYNYLDKWFDGYFYQTYKYLSLINKF